MKSHNVVANRGSNVTLRCEVLDAIWYLALWGWQFNGAAVSYDQDASPHYSQSCVNFHDSFTMALDICNVSERDAGLYECVVFTILENVRSNITLIVNEQGNIWLCYVAGISLATTRAFIGYFVITWHLTTQLFPAKNTWAGNNVKTVKSEGNIAMLLQCYPLMLPANVWSIECLCCATVEFPKQRPPESNGYPKVTLIFGPF